MFLLNENVAQKNPAFTLFRHNVRTDRQTQINVTAIWHKTLVSRTKSELESLVVETLWLQLQT
jgi:hypothetical protein